MTQTTRPATDYDILPLVRKWKDKRGNLIMILHEIQNALGYVPRDLSLKLSEELGVPLARIYEVISFYNYFKLVPPGVYNIAVCLGTACYLNGGQDLINEIGHILGIKEGETTPDGLFRLESVRCLGCCGLAPVLTVNGKVYGKVKKEDILGIISSYTKKDGQ
jgi:NADH-quinone oxidoreductase subunit E